jgi:hypothetical protein
MDFTSKTCPHDSFWPELLTQSDCVSTDGLEKNIDTLPLPFIPFLEN